PIGSHNPVRIQKRKLGMLCDSVDVSLCQESPLVAYLPVFSSEVQVAVLSSQAKHVRNAERATSGAVYDESSSNRLPPISCGVDFQRISCNLDRSDFDSRLELDALAFRIC